MSRSDYRIYTLLSGFRKIKQCVFDFLFYFFNAELIIRVHVTYLPESLMHALVWPSVLVWAAMFVWGQPCQPDEFDCLTGCLPEKYVCDFSQDCSDGSDERDCKY